MKNIKKDDDIFLKAYKEHRRENKIATIILLIGSIIFLLFKQYEPFIFVFCCTIIYFILYLIARKNIKTYETYRNSRKH